MSKTPHPTSASRRTLGSVAGHSAVGGSSSSSSWEHAAATTTPTTSGQQQQQQQQQHPAAATSRVRAAASRFRRGSSGDLEAALPASPGDPAGGSHGGSPRSGAFASGMHPGPLGGGGGSGGGVGGGGGLRQRAAAAAMEDVGAPGSLARSAHIRAMLMQVHQPDVLTY
jgi:hypothetical protein